MPKINSTPRWRRSAWVAGALAWTLGMSACSHLNNGCNCSTDANASPPVNAAVLTPRTPLVTQPIAYPPMQVAPPVAPPLPTGTVLYPWRVDPLPPQANTASPVVNAVELPRLAPPAPPESVPLALPVATPAAAPRATAHSHPPAATPNKVTRSKKVTQAKKVRKVNQPTRTAKAIKATAPPRAPTPARTSATRPAKPTGRLPTQPLDCPNLWRTNPYLADQMRCPAATRQAAPPPSAMGWPPTPAMGTASPGATPTYPTRPGQTQVQPTWLPGTGVPITPPPTPPAR